MINKIPTSVDELVLPDAHTAKRVSQYAAGKRHGNIIFHGPKGTGKSATAHVIAETRRKTAQSTYPAPIYNGANVNERTLERFYNEWNLQRLCGVEYPYIIIDEADKLTMPLQHKLRAVLDSTEIGNVILTTNHIHRVDEPLVDRCDDIEMPPINVHDWYGKAVEWLNGEGIAVDEHVLKELLSTNNGTIRDLQRAITDVICEHK